MNYKRYLPFFSTIVVTACLAIPAQAKLPEFVQDARNLYLNTRRQIESFGKNIFPEAKSKAETAIQSKIDDLAEEINPFDVSSLNQQVNTFLSSTKEKILDFDTIIKSQNQQQKRSQDITKEFSKAVVGSFAQELIEQEQEIGLKASQIAIQNAQSAQNEDITQEVMKKIAVQNAQTVTILKLMQNSLQEQKQLSAIANVNLADISSHYTQQQREKQMEYEGLHNAIRVNSSMRTNFWNNNP